eukprot:2565970-Rhodomonas_salina.1
MRTVIYIPDEQYNSFMDEVLKVPVKKRKNWKDCLEDKLGTKTKLIYKEGKLMNYSIPTKKFEEVIPQSKMEEMKKDPKNNCTLTSDFAKSCSDEDKAKLKDDILEFLFDMEVEGNHT